MQNSYILPPFSHDKHILEAIKVQQLLMFTILTLVFSSISEWSWSHDVVQSV